MPTVAELCSNLAAEHDSLDAAVAGIPAGEWSTPTPAERWDVRDSISHLCYFDETATMAIEDPAGFEEHKATIVDALRSGLDSGPDVAIGRELIDPADLLARWRRSRGALIGAAGRAGAVPEPPRVPWYGPPMSLASFVTARIMETWAHGVDVRDALGLPLEPTVTPRLKHVCHIAFGARAYTFAVHGVADPGDPVSFEVVGPGGVEWTWGSPDAAQRITGSALDIALVFTQRRHPSRTAVRAAGPVAEQWLAIAQAFAGPATVASGDR